MQVKYKGNRDSVLVPGIGHFKSDEYREVTVNDWEILRHVEEHGEKVFQKKQEYNTAVKRKYGRYK